MFLSKHESTGHYDFHCSNIDKRGKNMRVKWHKYSGKNLAEGDRILIPISLHSPKDAMLPTWWSYRWYRFSNGYLVEESEDAN